MFGVSENIQLPDRPAFDYPNTNETRQYFRVEARVTTRQRKSLSVECEFRNRTKTTWCARVQEKKVVSNSHEHVPGTNFKLERLHCKRRSLTLCLIPLLHLRDDVIHFVRGE